MKGAGVGRGVSVVGVGLLLFGAASYGFLAVAARACHPARFSALSLLWIITTTLGAGLFLPLEQELARFVADRRGRHEPAGSGLVAAGRAAILGVLVVVLVGVAGRGPLTRLLDGDRAVLLAVLANLVAQALAYLARGVAAGTERFSLYGGQLALEGLLRIALAVALTLLGAHTAAPYGFALATSTVLSVAITAPAARALFHDRGRENVHAVVSGNLSWLVVAALAAQALANSTPLLIKLRGSVDRIETAQFFATLLVARIPLFLFAAVQAALLPGLSRARGAGDVAGFRSSLRRVEQILAGLGVGSVAGAALVGVPTVKLVFGDAYSLGRGTLVLLAAGTAVYIVANVQSQAALALGRHRTVAGAWVAGCLVGLAVAFVPGAVISTVAWAFLAGAGAALALLAWTARRAVALPWPVAMPPGPL